MIYLACPYTHPDHFEMEYRYKLARNATAHLTKENFIVYCPVVHFHEVAKHHDLPHDWNFWQNIDLHMLDLAEELWVLQLDCWHTSRGVLAEIAHAHKTDKPVIFIEGFESEDYKYSGSGFGQPQRGRNPLDL